MKKMVFFVIFLSHFIFSNIRHGFHIGYRDMNGNIKVYNDVEINKFITVHERIINGKKQFHKVRLRPVTYDPKKTEQYILDSVVEDEDGKKISEYSLVYKNTHHYYYHKFGVLKEENGKKIVDKEWGGGVFINKNNTESIGDAVLDDMTDFVSASMTSYDNRKQSSKASDKYQLWVRYDVIPLISFKLREGSVDDRSVVRNSLINILNVGVDFKDKTTALNGLFFIYGREDNRYYRGNRIYPDLYKHEGEDFNLSNSNANMFGLGLNRSQEINDMYYDVVLQANILNKKIYSVNDITFFPQNADVFAYNIGVSLEVGEKFFLSKNIYLTPQVQYMYNYYHQKQFKDSLNEVQATKILHVNEARLGLKLNYKNIYSKFNTYINYVSKVNVKLESEIGGAVNLDDYALVNSSLAFKVDLDQNFRAIKFNLGITK